MALSLAGIALLSLPAPGHPQPDAHLHESAGHLGALDPRWAVRFDTPPAVPAGFDEQTAYIALDGQLVGVNLDTGAIRWRASVPTEHAPAAGDGLVFAGLARQLVALEQRTGAVEWRIELSAALAAAPYWDAGWLIATLAGGDLVGARASDGHIIWQQPLGSPLEVPPAPAGDRLYVALADRRLLALDLATGDVVWTRPFDAAITGLLALGEQLVIGTRGNRLHSVDLDTGRDRWSQRTGADLVGTAAADERRLYFTALDNVLRAADRRTGNLHWTRALPSRPRGTPLRVLDVVIVPHISPEIGAYAASTGRPAFTFVAAGELAALFLRDTPRPTAPRVVALTRDGTLQGFAPRYEPPPAPLGELPGVRVGG